MPSYNVIICAVSLFLAIFEPISAKSIQRYSASKPIVKNGCVINLKKDVHKENPPMILSLSNLSYHYPSTADPVNLYISENAKIGIFCPGRSNRESSAITEPSILLHKNSTLKSVQETEPIVCKSSDNFEVAKVTVNFSDLSCQAASHASYNAILRKHATKPECNKGLRYEIGYEIGEGKFLRTIELCHDKAKANTLWSHAVIEPANRDGSRYSGERHGFKTGMLYKDVHISKNDPYSLKSAYETVKWILGKGGNVDDYLATETSARKFLAKGHLIASADKVYKSEQDSTMFYANVVPMWQQVNANPGNWYLVEEYVRHLAFHKDRAFQVWAGGLGVLKLQGKEIYLYKGDKIPVPKVIYKCVVDERMKEALCFVVVNNPYAAKKEVLDKKGEYRVCKKLEACDNISLNFDDPSKGYFYCCELGDFYERNKKVIGLDELGDFVDFTKMELLTNDKLHETIKWSKKDEKMSFKRIMKIGKKMIMEMFGDEKKE